MFYRQINRDQKNGPFQNLIRNPTFLIRNFYDVIETIIETNQIAIPSDLFSLLHNSWGLKGGPYGNLTWVITSGL